tara:strand:- start:232 stop:918 length:687 start_codon:yes stop_codon:yes gene_type:complete
MDEQNNPESNESQPNNLTQDPKIWKFVIVAIATAVVVGSGIYAWQYYNLQNVKSALQQQIGSLQSQFSQLQNEYDNIKSQQTETPAIPAYRTSYELTTERCTQDDCLFNKNNSDYPLGISTIKGYYSPLERTAWGETKTCDSFTITDGSEELIRAMVHLVDIGNSVHTKNELNQPVINLGFGVVGESDKQTILDSTQENQIELLVLSDSPIEAGVPVCWQDVWVLGVK